MPPLIEFRNVTVLRKGRRVLDNVTFCIPQGQHTAILGPNGSGKSSLIKTITRELYPQPWDGTVLRILGRDRWNVFDLRVLLGIVTNDLLDTIRRNCPAREIILSGFFSSIGVWPHHEVTQEMEQKADQIIERLHIGHLAERRVDELSSGEARSVLIARALVHDPLALVLDEPTNSLDIRAFHELQSILRRLAGQGITLVLVTHHLPDVIPEVGRVVLLRDGRVYRDGPKEEVLEADALSGLFRTRVDVERRDGFYHIW